MLFLIQIGVTALLIFSFMAGTKRITNILFDVLLMFYVWRVPHLLMMNQWKAGLAESICAAGYLVIMGIGLYEAFVHAKSDERLFQSECTIGNIFIDEQKWTGCYRSERRMVFHKKEKTKHMARLIAIMFLLLWINAAAITGSIDIAYIEAHINYFLTTVLAAHGPVIGIVLGILIIAIWIKISYGKEQSANEDSVSMHILNKRYASKMDGVDRTGNMYQGANILGVYCFSWILLTGYSEKDIDGIRRNNGGNIDFLNTRAYRYAIETDAGWFYCYDFGAKMFPWSGIGKLMDHSSSVKIKITLHVAKKADLTYLDTRSSIARLYNQYIKDNHREPIFLDVDFLS